jgi:hypothetical protein
MCQLCDSCSSIHYRRKMPVKVQGGGLDSVIHINDYERMGHGFSGPKVPTVAPKNSLVNAGPSTGIIGDVGPSVFIDNASLKNLSFLRKQAKDKNKPKRAKLTI